MMDLQGTVIDEFTFTNNHDGIASLASRLTMDDRVVMESTGSVWTNLYNHLDDAHIPVVLANPPKTKAVACTRIKSHEIDARILAHLLRAGLVQESYDRPNEFSALRDLRRHGT